MNNKSTNTKEDLQRLNDLLKNDWGLQSKATLGTPLTEVGLNLAAGDLQCLASSLLGGCPIQDLTLEACRTIGDLLDAVGTARRLVTRRRA